MLERQGVSPVIHYLDDFLLMGPALSNKCQKNLITIQQLFGIPLAPEKLEGPTHCLTFLGIEIDTSSSSARLPQDKLVQIQSELHSWLRKRRVTKRKILSLSVSCSMQARWWYQGEPSSPVCTTRLPE